MTGGSYRGILFGSALPEQRLGDPGPGSPSYGNLKGGVAMESGTPQWEPPRFEEIGCAAEVTMYVAQVEE